MDTHRFFVEKMRFHLKNKNMLVFVGWFFDGSTKGHRLTARLDQTVLPLKLQINRGPEVRQKYLRSVNEIQEEVVGIIQLPEDWRSGRRLVLESAWSETVAGTFGQEPVTVQEVVGPQTAMQKEVTGPQTATQKEVAGQKSSKNYVISTDKLCKLENEILYYVENCQTGEGTVTVSGWCMAGGELKIQLCGPEGPLPSQKMEHYYRKDLRAVFPECDDTMKPGFLLRAQVPEGMSGQLSLEMRVAGKSERVRLTGGDEEGPLQFVKRKASDTMRYLRRNGMGATLHKIDSKLRKREDYTYDIWRKKYEVTPKELEYQRQVQKDFAYRPVFSIAVPLYKTNPKHLREMIASIQAQTYPEWELCMANASPEELTEILKEYAAEDSRIHFCNLEENEGISGNTNAALAMAAGEYIVLSDHDDIVPANALFEFAKALNEDGTIDVLYSDEDKISMNGRKYFEPHFKPDFNMDLLCSMNYICHLFGAKRSLVESVGGFDRSYDGAQDLDFFLRCCEKARNIRHIPKILYHWRCHLDSTAANPESKLYAFEAGRRAIEAHYSRCAVLARVENAQFYGMYRTVYEWEEEPLVSIIIPNKDHSADLAKCMNAIFERSDYRNFEFIIVENNSTEPETFAFYEKMEAEHDNVHVVYYKGGFNYSAINNFGVRAAKGEYLLLLNNDTEMIGENGIRELLGVCMREDVGIAGAKLLYEDETIQHAGVVIGFGGIAGHTFIGKARYDTGYFGRILCAQDYSAVTAACLMTKKSVYEEVGGLTEELAVAFNDVDYCLKVRRAGKLVVYNPYAEFFHYESKSRGYEDSPEKVERFNGEIETFLSRWREVVEKGDPYYNPNLTLDNSDFSLRR